MDSDGPLDPDGDGDHHGRSEGVESYSVTPTPMGEEPMSWKQKVGILMHLPSEVVVAVVAGAIREPADRRPGNPCRSAPVPQSSHCQYSSLLGMSSVNVSHTMD